MIRLSVACAFFAMFLVVSFAPTYAEHKGVPYYKGPYVVGETYTDHFISFCRSRDTARRVLEAAGTTATFDEAYRLFNAPDSGCRVVVTMTFQVVDQVGGAYAVAKQPSEFYWLMHAIDKSGGEGTPIVARDVFIFSLYPIIRNTSD